MRFMRIQDISSRLTKVFTTGCLLLTGLGFAVPASAETYRWVDANGVVNYSERKPRGVPANQVTLISDRATRPSSTPTTPDYTVPGSTDNASPSGNSAGAIDTTNLNADQRDMLADLQQSETERKAQVAKIRKDNCERSRRVLKNLSNVGRIRVRGEDGQERVLTEEERSSRIQEAQNGIAINCG